MSKILNFSELLVTKLCHDLAAPIGAVYNGAEFLEDDNTEEMRQKALSLIISNSKIAADKLKFFRYIYGKSDSNGESDLEELKKLTQDYFDSHKFEIIWDTETAGDTYIQLTHRLARLTLILVYLSSELLILGGKIEIKIKKLETGKLICVSGKGERIKPHEDILQIFASNKLKGLQVGNIITQLAHKIALTLGVPIQCTFTPDSFISKLK